MKVSYYPGCSLEHSAKDYAESIAAVADLLNLRLEEIPDWNCCGASAAHSLDEHLALALPARNLVQAAARGWPRRWMRDSWEPFPWTHLSAPWETAERHLCRARPVRRQASIRS